MNPFFLSREQRQFLRQCKFTSTIDDDERRPSKGFDHFDLRKDRRALLRKRRDSYEETSHLESVCYFVVSNFNFRKQIYEII
jgi:hypothetical protein